MVVGLGNPGPEYRHTRHNVGFDVVDALAKSEGVKLDKGRASALVGIGTISGEAVALVKPLTYMNRSGTAVASLARSYGLKPDHIVVVADDLDLEVGTLRLRAEGGHGGHNGHRSIIDSLGTNAYPRLKIGIGADTGDTVDHVLSKFAPKDRETIDEAIEVAQRVVGLVLTGEWNQALEALDAHNKRLPKE